jgi:hypothetical protein
MLFTLVLGDLNWRYIEGRPSRPSLSNPFIITRFIYKHVLLGTDMRRIMQVQVSEIGIPCLYYIVNLFLRLTARNQYSPYARNGYVNLEVVPHPVDHLILI